MNVFSPWYGVVCATVTVNKSFQDMRGDFDLNLCNWA